MSTLDPIARPPVVNPDGSWRYAARVVRWKDGDTVVLDCLVDTGFEEMATKRRTIRLLGVNTPESTDHDPAKRDRAHQATAYANAYAPPGSAVTVTVVRYDKYGGRDDGHVDTTVGDVAEALLDCGLGDPYDGGAR